MQILKIEQFWLADVWSAPTIFGMIALIATLLLVIFWVYSLFSEEPETASASTKSGFLRVDARTVLLFFTAFGWGATIASYLVDTWEAMLIWGAAAGMGVTFLANLWRHQARKALASETVVTSTGRVSASIPPHRAGIGKVYLNASRKPLELDAITIGRELPVGAPVRIVHMLDEHTAVVEPLEPRKKDQPPA